MSVTIEVPKFWVFRYRCGCAYGVLVADQRPQRVIATEDQAWHDFYRGKKNRRAKARAWNKAEPSESVPDFAGGAHDVAACIQARREATP